MTLYRTFSPRDDGKVMYGFMYDLSQNKMAKISKMGLVENRQQEFRQSSRFEKLPRLF